MKHLVIIDDEKSVLDALQIVLADHYRVSAFLSTALAQDFLESKPEIDGMLIDYHIGQESGVIFFRDVVRLVYPNLNAILISAFYDSRQPTIDQAEIKRLFLCDIEKPFDILQLRALVAQSF